MSRPGVLVVALLLSLAAVGGAAAAPGAGFGAMQSGGIETESVVLRATIHPDGDATWTIDYRIRLDDQNTTEAFQTLQQDIRNNTTDYRSQFAERMRSTIATAENATGREMAVANVSVRATTSFSGQYGVVSYSFHWTGFAATEGDRIVVGDALAGLFLDADTKLVFRWPEGYELRAVDPEPTARSDRSVTWEGPIDFGPNQPRLVIAEDSLLPAWAPLAAVGAFALLALAGGVWYYREQESAGETPEPDGPAATATSGDTEGEPEDEERAGGEPEPTAEQAAETASGAAAGADGAGDEQSTASESADAASTGSATPEELLSPEERVLALLEERGGRMKQKAVTEELDWSAARTSQVVGDLRDAGKVESFRLGRENVLKFPDDDDELVGNP